MFSPFITIGNPSLFELLTLAIGPTPFPITPSGVTGRAEVISRKFPMRHRWSFMDTPSEFVRSYLVFEYTRPARCLTIRGDVVCLSILFYRVPCRDFAPPRLMPLDLFLCCEDDPRLCL